MNNRHAARHQVLHTELDELAADYISNTHKPLNQTSVIELMQWSYEQTNEITINHDHVCPF